MSKANPSSLTHRELRNIAAHLDSTFPEVPLDALLEVDARSVSQWLAGQPIPSVVWRELVRALGGLGINEATLKGWAFAPPEPTVPPAKTLVAHKGYPLQVLADLLGERREVLEQVAQGRGLPEIDQRIQRKILRLPPWEVFREWLWNAEQDFGPV
jgi:hypothetical protein